MTAEPNLPFDASLLEPVTDARPCGDDLAFSAEFDQITQARREDDPTLEQGEWQTEVKLADWDRVIDRCSDLLRSRSKDLRLAGWLTEALVKTRGAQGLTEGLALLQALMERFWESLHPQAEQGDQDQRIGNLSWLNARLTHLVRQLPLTQAPDAVYGLAQHEGAMSLHARLARGDDQDVISHGLLTVEAFNQAKLRTPHAFYREQVEVAARARAVLSRLIMTADERFGSDGPSFSSLAHALESWEDMLQRIAREVGALGSESRPAHGAPVAAATAESVAAFTPGRAIETRVQALEMLRQVASFFRRTEPHSPVAYLAEKAAGWGTMPLDAWLRAVVKDQGALAHVEELLGVERKPDPAADS